MASDEVSVKITIEEKQALQALTKFSNNIKKTEQTATKSFSKMDLAVASFAGNLASNAVTALASFAKNGISMAVSEMVEFDLAIREINTLLPKTAQSTDKLKDELIKMSAQFGTSQAAQAKAFYQIISSGAAEGADATELLRQANILAVGGLSDVGSSIDLLSDILNIYGSENITAADAADTLFTTVRLGKTTIPELTASLGQVLPSARKLGLSLEDVGSALAAMTVQGLTTAERVTQLNGIFTALFKKSGEGAAKFGKEINAAFNVEALKEKGLVKFLEDLQIASGGNEEILSRLLGRTEALKGVFALTGDSAQILGDKIKGMAGKTGAAEEAFKLIEGSLSKQFDIALQNTTNSLTKMLFPLAEAARLSLQLFNSMFKDSSTAEEKIASLEGTIARLTNNLKKNDNFYTHFLGKDRSEDEKDLANAIAQLKELQKVASDAMGPKPLAATDDSGGGASGAVKKQLAVYEELNAMAAQQAIVEMENTLRIKEARVMLNEEELQELRDLEMAKLEIAKEFALEKASFIVDADKRKREQDKIRGKFELDNEKLKGKQAIIAQKKITQDEKSNFTIRNQTAANFMQAGLAITKEGSTAHRIIATADAIRNTYAAANLALASAPPPLNFAFAASTIALGLANVAKINSFETGGVVGGFNGASLGKDNTTANVRNGEMVLTGSQQKTLFNDISSGENSNNGEMMGMLQQIANAPVVVQIDGREIARANRTAMQEGFSA